jgi:hypothetical protein
METPQIDLDQLQKRAALVDCYVNRHRAADLTRGGDLYLMDRRTQRNPNAVTLAKFSTVAQVEAALTIVEQERFNHVSTNQQ